MAITFVRDEAGQATPVASQKSDTRLNTKTVIEVEGLRKTYGSTTAVDGISFTVGQGEIFGMLGPNGAGKSTTVEMVEGLRKADGGRISVLGADVNKDGFGIREKIGVQLQIPSLLPLLNVAEILEVFGKAYRHAVPANRLIEQLSLQESRKVLVKHLSGGQQQRLSVALAMVNDPDVLFLDEPTTGLDPQARHNLWNVIEDMRNRGKTVFLTTHYMEEAERLCDRVAIMDHGKIIALDTPANLIGSYFKESAIQFHLEPAPPKEVMQAFEGVADVTHDNGETVIYSSDVPATMSALFEYARDNGLTGKLKNVFVRQATLEDVFLKITGRSIRQ